MTTSASSAKASLIRVGPVHEVLAAKGHTVEAECALPVEPTAFAGLTEVSQLSIDGRRVRFFVAGDMAKALATVASFEPHQLVSREPTLTEVFMSLYEGDEAQP